ncbi:Probable nucleoredoxin 1 [Striga hermonthica]|uniref:Probable nucleoredoxin 1 n=1 Tax=Striga hermonthica TaxID=68872 RepID=A0A9N7MYR4_STRHE|nr:Probable nucleoredoxin 1 [Striga hermonthica]
MPWLAVPFSDTKTRKKLDKAFSVDGIPHLVFLDYSGKLLSEEGVRIIQEYGSEGYPFNSEKIEQPKLQEFEARKNQSLKSLLAYVDPLPFGVIPNNDQIATEDRRRKTLIDKVIVETIQDMEHTQLATIQGHQALQQTLQASKQALLQGHLGILQDIKLYFRTRFKLSSRPIEGQQHYFKS